jgi:hypothetical protein
MHLSKIFQQKGFCPRLSCLLIFPGIGHFCLCNLSSSFCRMSVSGVYLVLCGTCLAWVTGVQHCRLCNRTRLHPLLILLQLGGLAGTGANTIPLGTPTEVPTKVLVLLSVSTRIPSFCALPSESCSKCLAFAGGIVFLGNNPVRQCW